MYTIDFETESIEEWPEYPPAPVGLAVKHNDQPGYYLAFGHPSANNSTFEDTAKVLKDIWDSGEGVICHHAKFDLAVVREFYDLPELESERIHDTTFLLFLHDPLADTFSLKPSAEALLNWPPEEQDAVHQWLLAHGKVASNLKRWGGHIREAPGDLVGRYAIGDVDRTYALFQYLLPKVRERDMYPAYRRECELLPILIRNEFEGLRIDVEALAHDAELYEQAYKAITHDIKIALSQNNEEFNLDSGPQLAKALLCSGMTIGEDRWPRTPTGKLSTSRETLAKVLISDSMRIKLAYRGVLKTLLGTFMGPWLKKALQCEGYLHPTWNQVKGGEWGDMSGAKTGRLSCANPNLQNIPTEMSEEIPEGYPPLPLVRRYVLPDEEEVFVSADFHSQEVRILGHFAEGTIKDIYDADPSADVHAVAAKLIQERTGMPLDRKHTKITAFSILYGAGAGTMAERIGCAVGDAAKLKSAYLDALSGVRELIGEVEARARLKMPVRTWGGRLVHAPPPMRTKDGRMFSKDYVLVNYLIQGSAADQTKQAIIDYARTRVHGRFLATVHDEICISVPPEHLESEVAILKAAMEAGEFALPMRATIATGPNWASLEKQA